MLWWFLYSKASDSHRPAGYSATIKNDCLFGWITWQHIKIKSYCEKCYLPKSKREPKICWQTRPVVEVLAHPLSRVISDHREADPRLHARQAMSEPITTAPSLRCVAKSSCTQPQGIGKERTKFLKKERLSYPSSRPQLLEPAWKGGFEVPLYQIAINKQEKLYWFPYSLKSEEAV